ncbi:C-type lectin domain family 4 member A-like [Sorex fumeus]|uniref:C-type lectin domain family 4 member A-like n=1 Tax=Sorex fumeus TaxID=62283 RepID=UPI0024ACD9C2|nr:C-type lectin domain family 4 member A-like [Sorex fumeus]
MMTESKFGEMRFKDEPKSLSALSQAPAAPREKTRFPKLNTGCPKLLLAALLILLLLKISLAITFTTFFLNCFKLVQEETFTQEVTQTLLECRKENLVMEGKSWSCCPKNWKSFGSNCYFFSSEKKNWTDSEKHCAGMQAHLLVVDSKEEQDFIKNNSKENQTYYLGLSDLKNGHWEWVNETPYNPSVTFWHPGEPNKDYEHCVVLTFRSEWGWGWFDIPCNLHQESICEMLKIYI